MNTTPLPPLSLLEEVFQINPASPSGLSWRNSNGYKIKAGSNAGCLNKKGYWVVGLKINGKNKLLSVHRIIYFMHTKANVDGRIIDHIDLNKSNNNINNLRLANLNENKWNQKKSTIKTTSKYKGVHWCNRDKKWIATICCNGKRGALGYYETEEQAAHAYNKEALKLHGEFAKLNNF